MEIEALEAILMDDFKGLSFLGFLIPEIHSSESGLNTSNRCFQITLCPQDDELDESTNPPVRLGLIFSHTEKYPDEPPLLSLKSLKGIPTADLKVLKEKLEQEAAENLGMAMVYTLVTSAKEWLSERFSEDAGVEDAEEDEAAKDEIIVPHGEPVTVDSFLAWRERFEAELALERAKLMPDSALTAPRRKNLAADSGSKVEEHLRSSFFHLFFICHASSNHRPEENPELLFSISASDVNLQMKGSAPVAEGSDEDEEDIDFDDDDFEDDEEDMLEHYLAEKSDSSTHTSRGAN
ncbi:UNVERIFIED_CONTAM: RWD domain-containing protein 1 [Sesamum latifolium]|uniref:RWD domain-containing protein 1 n=1 Tax=Sesamum latifolium TaxID=2727402 RepID=A0AAW2UE21_9LAMI